MDTVKDERGSSLIEVMAALVIFLVGAMGWLSLEASLAKQTSQSNVLSQAVFLGQSQVDVLRQIPYDQLITNGTPQLYDSEGTSVDTNGFYKITWLVEDLPADKPVYKNVKLFVSWDFNAGEFENAMELTFSRSK